MTDAVIYAWRAEQGDVWTGEWALDRADKWVPAEANKYILATPKALAASPEVQALIAEAVAAEQVRCADVDLIHEAICNAHDMDATFSDYARSVAAAIRRAEGETT